MADPVVVIQRSAPTRVVVVQQPRPVVQVARFPGPRGPQGAPGVEDVGYTHVQSAPSAAWVIDHPLDFYPSVTVVDSAGTVVLGTVTYDSESRVTVTFAGAFSGEAHLS